LTSTQLAVLVEIRRTGSLARAALNLSVTPPAVSQQLARMEKAVGATLVTRGARGARLTTLGMTLAEHGDRVLAEIDKADEAAAAFIDARARRLRVGAFPSASVALLPEALAALRFRFPDAELSVVDLPSDGGAELIIRGDLDVALSASYGRNPRRNGVRFAHVHNDPLHLVVPDDHALAMRGADAVDFAELAHETWVSGLTNRPSRQQLDDRAANHAFVPRVAFQTESYDVAQAIVAAGVAVALIPRLALVHRPGTVALALQPGLSRDIFAVLPGCDDEVCLAGELLRVVRRICDSTTGEHAPGRADMGRSSQSSSSTLRVGSEVNAPSLRRR
jgi:DNA-binding transcriptional LysR family regulator